MNNQLNLSSGRDAADRFDRYCSTLLPEDLGEKIEGPVVGQITTLVALLGSCFGASQHEMRGDPHAESLCDRRGLAVLMVACWMPKSQKSGSGGRGLKPSSVVLALRNALKTCRTFPTEGLINALARGERVDTWPYGVLKSDDQKERPLATDSAIAGAFLGEQFRDENQENDWSGDRTTPRNVAAVRLKAIRNLWTEHHNQYDFDQPDRASGEQLTKVEAERCSLCKLPRVSHDRLSDGCPGDFTCPS